MVQTVQVIATTTGGARAALTAAVPLARGSNARLLIIIPRISSNAAELERSAESTQLMMKRYREMVREIGAHADFEIICVSVGLDDLVANVCARHAVTVVGGPVGHWLTSPEERLANRLVLCGCQVIFVASRAKGAQSRAAA